MKGTNNQGSTQQITKFTAATRLYIIASVTTRTLEFKLTEAQLDDISFEPVGKYVVQNMELVRFKVKEVMKKMENSNVFGTGFPSPTR